MANKRYKMMDKSHAAYHLKHGMHGHHSKKKCQAIVEGHLSEYLKEKAIKKILKKLKKGRKPLTENQKKTADKYGIVWTGEF